MACEVCEHCENPVKPGDGTICQGYSYHRECYKCYICSETNLHGAEIFKGAIFCGECCKRIFQGCVTARRAKTCKSKRRPMNRVRPNVRRRGWQNRNRVLEMARLAAADRKDGSKSVTSSSRQSELSLKTKVIKPSCNNNKMKKDSIDMGMTTDVTQELLMQINCTDRSSVTSKPATPPRPRKKLKTGKRQKKKEYSDIRIAELGASTEIAHMTLTNHPRQLKVRSEVPVIIKSRSEDQHKISKSPSPHIGTVSDSSNNSGSGEWTRSTCTKELSPIHCSNAHWMDRRLGSILKLPYRSFQKHILNRSSLISVLMSDRSDQCALRRIKDIFYDEVKEHHERGFKKLYTTINKKKTPYKLGWLKIESEPTENTKCKHFDRSHSYRCMRAFVMKRAGPTRSELALLRGKMKNYISTDFLRNIFNYNKQYMYLMTSQAGGKESSELRDTM